MGNWGSCFVAILLLFFQTVLTKSYNGYKEGEALMVMFNSLTSDKSIFPLSSKLLPLCSSKSNEIKGSPMNVGQILMGDNMQSSPYQFKMNMNQSFVHICDSIPWSVSQIQQHKKLIDENYHINMFLDALPALSPELVWFRKPWTGSPVGFRDFQTYHLFNHLKLKILVREMEKSPNIFAIVGFVADPCPCCHEVWPFSGPHIYALHRLPISCNGVTVTRELRENESIPFSFEVAFEKSNLKWEHRWDPYVDKKATTNLWFSVLFQGFYCFINSCAILHSIFKRRRKASQSKDKDEERANLPNCDTTIRGPPFPMTLSVLVGSGMQVLCTMFTTLLIGLLGFLSSSSRGSFLRQMIYCYVASAFAAGYSSVRIMKAMDTRKVAQWTAVTWRVACVFPAISAVGSVSLNTVHAGEDKSVVLSKKLLLLWGCVNVPLAFFGGYVAERSCTKGNYHLKSENPRSKWSWLTLGVLVLLWGFVTYGVCIDKVNHTVSRFVLGLYFTDFGYHLIAIVLLLVLYGQVGVLCKRRFGDDWWWISFLLPASSASSFYFIMSREWYQLKYSSIASSAVYCGYCFLFCLNFMLTLGAVGITGAFFSS